MQNTTLKMLLVASVLMPVAAYAQNSKPMTSTYISKEDIDKISATEQSKSTLDENARVIDLGAVNFELGIIHRASTRTPPPPSAGGSAAGAAERGPCGRQMTSLPPDGQRGGLTHDYQSEGYYIVSGTGTMFVDGYIFNGRHSSANTPGGPNGPSCGGTAYNVRKIDVKPGDVVVVPPGVVHGWADIPDHVDYLSFRMSAKETMRAGWVNPTIASSK